MRASQPRRSFARPTSCRIFCDPQEFGLRVSGVEIDYAAIQARREKVVTTLTSGVGGLFKKGKIDVVEGDATLTADGDVLADVFGAERQVIGAGSVILAAIR